MLSVEITKKKKKIKVKEPNTERKAIKLIDPIGEKSLMHRIEVESGLDSALRSALKAAKAG